LLKIERQAEEIGGDANLLKEEKQAAYEKLKEQS